MSKFIDINDREFILERFMQLKPDATALWGNMKPQQMVEHLIDQVRYTNGKLIPTLNRSPEEALQVKTRVLASDNELPRNVNSGPLPDDYTYPDIATAVDQLIAELNDFDEYYQNNPGITAIHGGFGPMNYSEWQDWHGRHFTHHLKQFSLLG